MELSTAHARLLLQEHAAQQPIDRLPTEFAFPIFLALQQALFERGLSMELQVATVWLQNGPVRSTTCIALVQGDEVLGQHGAEGWEQAGQVAARVQNTYSRCGDFERVGDIGEYWPPGASASMDAAERNIFEAWLARGRALLEQAALDGETPAASPARHSAPRL